MDLFLDLPLSLFAGRPLSAGPDEDDAGIGGGRDGGGGGTSLFSSDLCELTPPDAAVDACAGQAAHASLIGVSGSDL